MTKLSPMELAEIGEACRGAVVPSGGTLMHCDEDGNAGPITLPSSQTIAERVLAELERRGYHVVREGG